MVANPRPPPTDPAVFDEGCIAKVNPSAPPPEPAAPVIWKVKYVEKDLLLGSETLYFQNALPD